MPAYKEKDRNTWTVKFKHKNWNSETKWVTKRGFVTKRDALQYERDFLARQSGNLDMSFATFVEVYREDRGARIKESTLSMKDNIIDAKLIPYFGKKCMREITTKDIMLWQNELLAYRDPKNGKPYSKSYLKTIHNQLSAIFNHAVRYYKLAENPARTVGNMGSEKGIEMKCWTREEYLKFSEYMMDDPSALQSPRRCIPYESAGIRGNAANRALEFAVIPLLCCPAPSSDRDNSLTVGTNVHRASDHIEYLHNTEYPPPGMPAFPRFGCSSEFSAR